MLSQAWAALGGENWGVPEQLAERTAGTCQEFYESLEQGRGGDTACGLPHIKFLWDWAGLTTASYCDLYGVTCCDEQSGPSRHTPVYEVGRNAIVDGSFQGSVQVVHTNDSHEPFDFDLAQDMRPLELLSLASGAAPAVAGLSCRAAAPHTVIALDLRGFGLVGNLSAPGADSRLLAGLPGIQMLMLSNNPGLTGAVAPHLSRSLQHLDIVSTGLEMWPWSRLLTHDAYVRHRTAITGTMATLQRGPYGHATNSTAYAAAPAFIAQEHSYLSHLYMRTGEHDHESETTEAPDYPGSVGGMLALSLNVAEAVPVWQRGRFARPPHLSDCVEMIPYARYMDETAEQGERPVMHSVHSDPLNETIICQLPVLKSTCDGHAPAYTLVQAHPILHAYHPHFCSCAQPLQRVAFFSDPRARWRADTLPSDHPDANATTVVAMCVPGVGNALFQDWVFLPMGIYLLANVLMVLAKRSSTLQDWVRRRYHPHAALKRKHQPGDIRFFGNNGATVKQPEEPWTEVTLVMTDVEGSTAIWEWSSEIMNAALSLHDECIRQHIDLHYGLEVMTEGDAFIVAFHEAHNAVTWCLHMQEELLRVQWPPRLSEHPLARTVTVGDVLNACAALPRRQYARQLLDDARNADRYQMEREVFRGLRVRMAVHTDVPDACEVHDVTGSRSYKGSVSRFTKVLTDFATGGQVVLSAAAFGRVRSERNMFMAHQALGAALAASRRKAASREAAALSPTNRLIRQLLALKEALGWRESLHTGSTILLLDMGLLPRSDRTPLPQSLYVDNVAAASAAHVIRLPVQYGSQASLYQAITRDLHVRTLLFDATFDVDIDTRTGFFAAPGALEYLLGCPLPFVCSVHVLGKWDSSIGMTATHKRFFHEMMVHVSAAYGGYVSACDWDAAAPAAHMLFMLPEEAIAAAATMHLIAGELRRSSAARAALAIADYSLPHATRQRTLPLLLRIGVSCDACNLHFPNSVTGRLVIQGAVSRQGKTTANLASWHQLLVDLQSLQAAFHSPQLQEEERLGVIQAGRRNRRILDSDGLVSRIAGSTASRQQSMQLDRLVSGRMRTVDSITSMESKASGAPDAAPAHRTLAALPVEQHVLQAKFLGRFYMQSCKKACQLAAVYDAEDRGAARGELSRSAQHTQIAKPNVAAAFDVAEVTLLSPAAALAVLLDNVRAEEALRAAYADRNVRTHHSIW